MAADQYQPSGRGDDVGGRGGLLRERDAGGREVNPIELFFDLVYVLAIT